MEPLLTELYSLKGPKGSPTQAISGKREAMHRLPWERRGDSLRGEGPYQQKKSEPLARRLLEARGREKPPAEGAERPGQGGRAGQEAPQQPAAGREQERRLQDGVGLEHKERLQPGSWSLDFESESAHEEGRCTTHLKGALIPWQSEFRRHLNKVSSRLCLCPKLPVKRRGNNHSAPKLSTGNKHSLPQDWKPLPPAKPLLLLKRRVPDELLRRVERKVRQTKLRRPWLGLGLGGGATSSQSRVCRPVPLPPRSVFRRSPLPVPRESGPVKGVFTS